MSLDLGASWIHGVSGNRLTRLTREWQVATLPTEHPASPVTYSAGGRVRTPRWWRIYRQLVAAAGR